MDQGLSSPSLSQPYTSAKVKNRIDMVGQMRCTNVGSVEHLETHVVNNLQAERTQEQNYALPSNEECVKGAAL